jgi:recombination protein RecA
MTVVRSFREEEAHIFTAHEFLEIAEDTIHNQPGAVIVIDSVSQLVTSGEMENELNKQDRAPGAKLMSKFCRRLSNVLPVNDIILIGILHIYANTSGYGKSKAVSGGTKIQYAQDVGLECTAHSLRREGGPKDTTGKVLGIDTEWITTSAAFAPPGNRGKSTITFGIGLDELSEIVDMAIEFGFISKGGAWYTLSYMEDFLTDEEEWDEKNYKVQGKARLLLRLQTSDNERKLLEKVYNEMIGD